MLGFIVCGLEHSGTTLVSDLLRQVDHIEAGFEVGVLLCETPRRFIELQPYCSNILDGWEITRADLEFCCDTDEFGEFYDHLFERSPLIGDGITCVFDKTPRYLAVLRRAMARVAVSFIVLYKDPRATVYSDFSRARSDDFDAWYEKYKGPKIRYMQNHYAEYLANKDNPRVHAVRLEGLCLDTLQICRRMFEFLSLPFALDYLLLKNLRYSHTRDTTVSPRIVLGYRDRFTPTQQRRIKTDFAEFDEWFFDV